MKPLPAGTVNPLIFTVAHFCASETSSRDEIVPIQGEGVDANEEAWLGVSDVTTSARTLKTEMSLSVIELVRG